MKFYDREEEQELLENIREASLQESQMTVLFGRRRIGKTQLALQCTAGNLTLYFFVARKAETLLCQDFVEEAENKLLAVMFLLPSYSVTCLLSPGNVPLILLLMNFKTFSVLTPLFSVKYKESGT